MSLRLCHKPSRIPVCELRAVSDNPTESNGSSAWPLYVGASLALLRDAGNPIKAAVAEYRQWAYKCGGAFSEAAHENVHSLR